MATYKSTKIFQQPDDGAKLVSATNRFAWELYSSLSKGKAGQNMFMSPASISIALGMIHLGAKNDTLTQMAGTLHFDDVAPEHLHTSLSDLQKALNDTAGDYVLKIANRLYGQKGFSFLSTFLEATKTHYNAEIKDVDFGNEAEARAEINQWVEAQTNNKIQNLIPSGVLNSLVRLVLVNAIFFKGDWAHKFEKRITKDEEFFIDASNSVKVPMMHQTRKFKFGQSGDLGAKALELPYKGNNLSMLILLPEEKDGLTLLEQKLTYENLNALNSTFQMESIETVVSLPKFKLEDNFSLGETLARLGMADLFNVAKADLSGVTAQAELFVSKVLHKAFINVDEEGSEAAAATAGMMMMMCMPITMQFKGDHPFLFMIRSNQTGSILFIGRMMHPSADEGAGTAPN